VDQKKAIVDINRRRKLLLFGHLSHARWSTAEVSRLNGIRQRKDRRRSRL